ncbi:MAG: IS200/IS605 family element transposase accessory protein TnpB [Candidatus Dadabacteria bacterium]|nr:IS200/IS605 family element transposase accessory protein TnpB [Candidatus Dadabacteria bacterium]MYA48872.1 IS200/IS605 family element transposase accessory protein TnpB [Candidatus Dadabacteria bacterium]MYG83109.1 IS200/IS605 family element transposase accessory protein TnpB [Candidatus Dadabacteria bacterium]MYK49393.1 IS200/IS605 family element transposase accessory protein TnpB [Candidatus Dadabacteria bacterium]
MTKEMRSVEFVVLPTSRTKARKMFQIAGACRFVWNHFRDKNLSNYQKFENGKADRPSASYFSLGIEFTRLRHETAWLLELPANPVKHTLKYFADALKQAVQGKKGFPKPKSRKKTAPSFTLPSKENFRIKKLDGKYSLLRIPLVGWVRLTRRGGNPHEGGTPKQVVLRHDGHRWRAFVFYEVEVEKKLDDREILGVDMNVRQISTSDGHFYFLPDLRKKEARRKRYQRRMARQVKGSNRRKDTKKRLAKVSRKIASIRRNWIHQTTKEIADKCGTVAVEDLNVKGMTASAKGTVENPGKNVKQKTGLNRAILDTAFREMKRNLEYKCGRLIEVHPEYTSQACSKCGHTDKENRKTQSRFQCICCGFASNADTNAAINIRRLGMAQLHGEGIALANPANREIDTRLPYGQSSI